MAPSVDDFEIVSMQFERSQDGEAWPTVVIEFSGFRSDLGPEASDSKDFLVTIRFGGLQNVKMEGFNHQNTINGLIIWDKWSENLNREVFSVEIVQGFGVGAKFECSQIEVLSVVPWPGAV